MLLSVGMLAFSSAALLASGPAARATPSRADAPIMAESNDMKTFLAGTSAGEAEEWDEAWGMDSFADLELKGVWERAGKGKKRWAPGDTTGDATVDASLLYSTWVMNRPDLYAREACPSCTTTRFVLGHLDFPYNLILEPIGASASAQPVLDGQGVPASVADGVGLQGSLSICSFAAAHARKGIVAPATGRPDVREWLSEAAAGTSQLDALAAMLGAACTPLTSHRASTRGASRWTMRSCCPSCATSSPRRRTLTSGPPWSEPSSRCRARAAACR